MTKEKALEAWIKLRSEIDKDNWLYVGTINPEMVDYAIEGIESLTDKPKTGSWVKVSGYATPGGDPVWRCSECGKGLHVYGIEHGTYGADIADSQWVACPNCGRVMV